MLLNKMDASTELIGTKGPLRPKFFYCCKYRTNQLTRTNLLSGEQSRIQMRGYQFKSYCRWNELLGGNLLITGGGDQVDGEVVQIDTLREFAVSAQPPMHTARRAHAAVLHYQYLYVLAGWNGRLLNESERYVCAESRWEVLPSLPVKASALSAVGLDNSLYAFGGFNGNHFLDAIQKLSLDSLTWELMQLKLPEAAYWFPCFKTDTQVYLMLKKTMYSFTSLEVKPIQTVHQEIARCETSYYNRGTLYYSWDGQIGSSAIWQLTSL
jgi:hypothetical protein